MVAANSSEGRLAGWSAGFFLLTLQRDFAFSFLTLWRRLWLEQRGLVLRAFLFSIGATLEVLISVAHGLLHHCTAVQFA